MTDLLNTTPLQLFQSHSLPQIQELSTNLNSISKAKHEEIRNLVGSKYRDLLISADEIKTMESLAHDQDRKLYDLIFGGDEKSNNDGYRKSKMSKIGVDSNIEKFLNSGLKNIKVLDDHVLRNSEFFIKLSKFLKISEDDTLQNIETWILELGFNWGSKTNVIMEKFKEVEVIIFGKLEKIDDIEELYKLKNFILERKEFNLIKYNELLFLRIRSLINVENLRIVLEKFPDFQKGLEQEYEFKINESITTLDGLISKLNPNGEKLTLYELKFDDDYLKQIDYLSKGLVFKEYQVISDGFQDLVQILNYMKLINGGKYEYLNEKYREILNKFKQHAKQEKNQLLIKYLSS